MQREPNSLALRMPFHFAGLTGGFQRRSLTGGLAKGMPRNAVIVPSDLPSSLPVSIFTVGAESAARMLTAANKEARNTALAAEERPSLIVESPVEARGTISQLVRGLAVMRSAERDRNLDAGMENSNNLNRSRGGVVNDPIGSIRKKQMKSDW